MWHKGGISKYYRLGKLRLHIHNELDGDKSRSIDVNLTPDEAERLGNEILDAVSEVRRIEKKRIELGMTEDEFYMELRRSEKFRRQCNFFDSFWG